MKTRKIILATAAVSAAVLSAAASAQVFNPENDSTTYFRYQPSAVSTARQTPATLPSVGQQTADGLYVYSGGERGWVNRPHSYTVQAGRIVHTADCLPHNLPPVAAAMPQWQKGAFADHGA